MRHSSEQQAEETDGNPPTPHLRPPVLSNSQPLETVPLSRFSTCRKHKRPETSYTKRQTFNDVIEHVTPSVFDRYSSISYSV
jgi:hypothetical protein